MKEVEMFDLNKVEATEEEKNHWADGPSGANPFALGLYYFQKP